ALGKSGRRNQTLGSAGEVGGAESVEIADDRVQALAQLGDALLGVGVLGRILRREPRDRELALITGRLNLPDQRELVGGQPGDEQRVRVELLALRKGFGLVEPALDVLEEALELRNGGGE